MTSPLATGSGRPVIKWNRLRMLLAVLPFALLGCGEEVGRPLLSKSPATPRPTAGPLAIASASARYFTDAGGRTVYLTGSHTWNNFQDWGLTDPPPAFDYAAYLRFLSDHGHNFIRLYVWEQAAWFPRTEAKVIIAPLPYLRTGPGRALDGGLRFDVTRFNPAYFSRLRERVQAAGAQGIYVSVMLFDGWSIELKQQTTGNPWRGHPFNRENNINGIDGDVDRDGEGKEVHTLVHSPVNALQKTYVRKVVETLGDLDNVLWEISNESPPGGVEWEYEMIRTVHELEAARGMRHPVGMTSTWPKDDRGNAPLFGSPAEWIAPNDNPADPYKADPPPSDTRNKIVLSDTDHLWGIGGSPGWVWKTFFRGLNPLFMDPYQTEIRSNLPAWPETASTLTSSPAPRWENVRKAMGYAHALAERLDLASLRPIGALASSGYCLAMPGQEYLAYLPSKPGRIRRLIVSKLGPAFHERVELDLSAVEGSLDVEWVDAQRGLVFPSRSIRGGRRVVLRAPFSGDAVVHLRRAPQPPPPSTTP